MQIKQRAAVLAAGLLGVAGLGTGVAVAQSSTTSAPPAATATSPDNTELPGTEVEGVEQAEPGEANLPGGGHADAPGQNVDHQFEGVE
jgi:hypothetical protein